MKTAIIWLAVLAIVFLSVACIQAVYP